jgi:DNA repair exonuclease SbcCD ATPase subunit
MIIRKLSAVFGRLDGETLELKEGLNIIEAPNESGKSTWSHFIRAMLYGVSTSERARAGFLPDKQRFMPWSGRPMEGSMELRLGDTEITLRREPTGSGRPMGPCLAEYGGTGEKLPELTGKSVGERVLGVTEPVFRRSAFITRPEMAVDRDVELEKRITSLVTSGSEEESYTDADERLRRWQRKRRWRTGSGRIPEAEAELADTRSRLSRIEAENERLAALREERAKLEEQEKQLETELKRHKRDAFRKALEDHAAREKAVREARSELERLSLDARGVTRDDIRSVREARARLTAAEEAEEKARALRDEAEAGLKALTESGKEKKKPSFAVCALYALAVILLGVYFLAFRHVLIPVCAVLCLIAACAVLAVGRSKRRKEAAERIARAEEEYSGLSEKYDAARDECASLSSALSRALLKITKDEKADALDAAARAEELLSRLAEARARAEALGEPTPPPEPDEEGLELISGEARLSRRDTEEYLDRVRARLRQVSSELARGEGSFIHLGDPVLLGTRECDLEDELARLGREYDALELAADALKDANSRLQQVFSPIICRSAAELMSRMTGGGYSNVYFDRNMRFSAAREGDLSPRELEYLSDGTRDQLYLAVRLAVCMQALPREDPCPIILDDALTCFDDARAENALRLLLELAETRQIILFTCHGREKKLLEKILAEKK